MKIMQIVIIFMFLTYAGIAFFTNVELPRLSVGFIALAAAIFTTTHYLNSKIR